jgi:glyoxylase-like metal-dependent hydrolase (beta-lactamase superfamily II)
MALQIHPFRLPLPFRMGYVNGYLLVNGESFFLIDTGGPNNRDAIRQALAEAGCQPGSLKMILLTHGDFDHIGNAAYLRQEYGCRIAMHAADAPMGRDGDMFANRKPPNRIIRGLLPLFTGFKQTDRFTPDIALDDGTDLSVYGLAASVVSIPGHSRGSIGILTAEGDFFCGDLLENTSGPRLTSLMDDIPAGDASLRLLQTLPINKLYPGHGAPFLFQEVPFSGK